MNKEQETKENITFEQKRLLLRLLPCYQNCIDLERWNVDNSKTRYIECLRSAPDSVCMGNFNLEMKMINQRIEMCQKRCPPQ